MKIRSRKGFFILVGIFVVIYFSTWAYQEIDAERTYKGITDGERIDSIKMYIESDQSPNKTMLIVNDSELNNINRTFQYLQEFTPRSPKMHSVYIDIYIYKKKKLNIQLLKTTYSGWAISLYDTWYRNDSLMMVLNRYLKLDSIR